MRRDVLLFPRPHALSRLVTQPAPVRNSHTYQLSILHTASAQVRGDIRQHRAAIRAISRVSGSLAAHMSLVSLNRERQRRKPALSPS